MYRSWIRSCAIKGTNWRRVPSPAATANGLCRCLRSNRSGWLHRRWNQTLELQSSQHPPGPWNPQPPPACVPPAPARPALRALPSRARGSPALPATTVCPGAAAAAAAAAVIERVQIGAGVVDAVAEETWSSGIKRSLMKMWKKLAYAEDVRHRTTGLSSTELQPPTRTQFDRTPTTKKLWLLTSSIGLLSHSVFLFLSHCDSHESVY